MKVYLHYGDGSVTTAYSNSGSGSGGASESVDVTRDGPWYDVASVHVVLYGEGGGSISGSGGGQHYETRIYGAGALGE